MSVLRIVKYPDPMLREKCAPVTEITPAIRKLITDMLETMYAAPGVGLAAPQVGVPVRICVIDVHSEGRRQPMVLVNPQIVYKEGKMLGEEGCLSFPGLPEDVKRYSKVRVEALNAKGFPVGIEGEDILSRCLQHEIDHLDGKVYMDYLSLLKRKQMELEIKRRKKRGEW
jgi:peptide deformylase